MKQNLTNWPLSERIEGIEEGIKYYALAKKRCEDELVRINREITYLKDDLELLEGEKKASEWDDKCDACI